jgi:NAD-dependent SIR2 family protein deacetylase
LPSKFWEAQDLINGKIRIQDEKTFYDKDEIGSDLMIVAGTALAVFPFSMVVNCAPKGCP